MSLQIEICSCQMPWVCLRGGGGGAAMSQFDWYAILCIIMIIHVYCCYLQAHSLGNVISEQKFGLASRLSVKCNICHQVNNVTTSEQHRTGTRGPKACDTNTRLALKLHSTMELAFLM